jgi:SAM-dependent methyltransferase
VDSAEVRQRYGRVFDSVAEEYDRERRAYPDELVDAAMSGLAEGASVLEVGCGTGLLTEQLAARGLHVRALDPGEEMVRVARRRLAGHGEVDFEVGRFEDADVSEGYAAVFSASAWHWLDPAVSWRRAWEALRPGGRLCLLQDFAVADERVAREAELLAAAFTRAAPEFAQMLPPPRDRQAVIGGAHERRGDISAVWSWLSNYDLRDPSAARLFDDVRTETMPLLIEQTAERFNAYFRTTSFYARLAPPQRDRLEDENRRVAEQLGGTIRYGALAAVVSARRAGPPRAA